MHKFLACKKETPAEWQASLLTFEGGTYLEISAA